MNKAVDSNQSGNQSYVQTAQKTAADLAGSAQSTVSQAVDGLSGVLKCTCSHLDPCQNRILTCNTATADSISGQAKSNTK